MKWAGLEERLKVQERALSSSSYGLPEFPSTAQSHRQAELPSRFVAVVDVSIPRESPPLDLPATQNWNREPEEPSTPPGSRDVNEALTSRLDHI